jgi:hypothetical protein
MFGEDTKDWIGAKVGLYPSRVDFKGKTDADDQSAATAEGCCCNSFRRTSVRRRRSVLKTLGRALCLAPYS